MGWACSWDGGKDESIQNFERRKCLGKRRGGR
jgi:hypothetical protein